MFKPFKWWSRQAKEVSTSLSATELRLIDGGLLPRWDGTIPEMLKDPSAIADFRAFVAELKKANKPSGMPF